ILPYLQLTAHNVLVPPTQIDVTSNIFNPFDVLSTSGVPLLGNHISVSENIMALLAILGIALMMMVWKRVSILSKILVISGLTYFVLGSNLMPWPISSKIFQQSRIFYNSHFDLRWLARYLF